MNSKNFLLFTPTLKEASAISGAKTPAEQDGFAGLYWGDRFIVITGIGKVNTAITASKYFYNKTFPDNTVPVFAGIAGAYRGTLLSVGDVCMIQDDYFVDEAVYSDDKITGTHETGFPVCKNNKVSCITLDKGLPVCDGNTVSLLPGTDDLARLYHNKTGAWVESMEGAAFALAAVQAGLQTVQIRAISNYSGSKENQQWNAKKAFINLKKAMENIFCPRC